MKVLLVNKFHYLKGGSETYYFALGELLEKVGCQVIYFSMKDEKNYSCMQERYFVGNVDFNAPMSKIETVKKALKMLYSIEAKKKFEQLIIDEKPDIIHLNIFQSQLTESIVDVAAKYRIPMVYTAHDLKAVCPSYLMMNHGEICDKCIHGNYWYCVKTGCMKDSRAKSLLGAIEALIYRWRKTYKKINLIITPSAHHKRRIEDGKITDCPIIHMPNFLPVDTIYKNGAVNGKYFLFFGRVSREKGVMTLIKAYAKSMVDRPLYIVGTGPEEENIKQYVLENGLSNKIHILGFRTGKELKDIVSNAYCVCLPSECCENGPYSIMEAQAVGRPVIVSRNGGLPEMVIDGVTGFISTPNDVNDLAEKIKMANDTPLKGEDICEYAKKTYLSDVYIEKLIQYYRQLLKK